jgi:bifunctional oligoribonuclease and PAP phosphatase NrnA
MEKELTKLKEYLENKQHKILIVTHESPDPDGIGAALAFALKFNKLGIEHKVWIPEVLPKTFLFLPASETITNIFPNDFDYDTLLVLDASNLKRVKNYDCLANKKSFVINIDHHPDNGNFGDINILDSKSSSVGEITYNIFKFLDWELTQESAINLYSAICFDTGSFHYSNVSASTFLTAAELVKKGVKPEYVSQKLFESNTLELFDLLKTALGNFMVNLKLKFAYTALPECSNKNTHEILSFLRTLEDIDIFLIFRPSEDGFVKINLRSRNDFDVSNFASLFGGGGHKKAAGIKIKGELHMITKTIIKKLNERLSQ